MIRIDTPAEVRTWISRGALDRIPTISRQERKLLGVPCPCGAQEWLCLSPTGLPASAPHSQRLQAKGPA